MHGAGDARLQLAEGVAAVLVHPGGVDKPLAVLLDACGEGLLVTRLDKGLAVITGDHHIAGQYQQRGARGAGRGDIHNHIGETRALGAGGGHHLAGGAGKAIRHGAHGALHAAAVGGDTRRRQGVDHGVIAGAAKQGGQFLLYANLGEHLRPAHAPAFEFAGVRRFLQRGHEVGGYPYRRDGHVGNIDLVRGEGAGTGTGGYRRAHAHCRLTQKVAARVAGGACCFSLLLIGPGVLLVHGVLLGFGNSNLVQGCSAHRLLT